ncbi:MAG: NAD(P)H-dependent nitrite reductase catalytic subunit [Phycisphaerales bacterium]|nr:NAD(P)H-dependent nitrite reductase catalytic subunit [Phycisphaerales bacterium]
MINETFTEEQRLYLEGFVAGSSLKKQISLPQIDGDGSGGGAEAIHRAAQDRFVAAGKKLAAEEMAKRAKNGVDIWDQVVAHARDGKFPKGTDVFLFKFQGLFYVAPAQDSFMSRLRFPGGIVSSHQMRGLADLAQDCAGGYVDVTTRANLQLREIGPRQTVPLLMGLSELGIINRGAGADNIRNVTASPTAGIDPQELIDTRPLARELHHHILNNREMYGLPRKFNIAFDGGGAISALEDTNDIGFTAVRVGAGKSLEPRVYFRLTLGGITGHKDFARDTGVICKPDECTSISHAIVQAFSEHGDRTDRKKARLKYVLDQMGFEKFIKECERHLGREMTRFPLDECEQRSPVAKHGHVGIHPQKQRGLHYVGVVLPVGRISAAQMRGLARIADRHGSGTIRLTVWQNLLISDIPTDALDEVKLEIESLGLDYSATNVRAGLIACTGSAGCKFAAADTKRNATEIADYLESRLRLDTPVNIHLTGCHHSCAQHYIGDIGLIATKVSLPATEELVDGYHLFVGGGYGETQAIARELYRDIPATEAPQVVEGLLQSYLENRTSYRESFIEFVVRVEIDRLKELLEQYVVAA